MLSALLGNSVEIQEESDDRIFVKPKFHNIVFYWQMYKSCVNLYVLILPDLTP